MLCTDVKDNRWGSAAPGSSIYRQNITPTLKMEEETIKQIELKCPNCNHEMIADFDINELAKVEAHKLLDKAAEV